MLGQNGNTEITLIVDGTTTLIPDVALEVPNVPLPRAKISFEKVRSQSGDSILPTVTPVPNRPTLRTFIQRWRNGKNGLREGTLKKLDYHIVMTGRYLDMDRPVTEYKPQDIRDSVAKARCHLKGQTINESILRPLKNAFDLAVEERIVETNPVTKVERELIKPIHRQQLDWDNALKVLEEVKKRAPESYLILRAMLLLGIGQAECKTLSGKSIDWKKREVHFIRQKTGEPYEVPIYPWTEDCLHEIEDRFQPDKPIFVWRNPRKALETACCLCGFEPLEIRSLRRTLIVHLLEQGIEARLVAEWQGHRDATLVNKVYGKHINAAHRNAQIAKLV